MKNISTEKNILSENNELLKDYFKDISKYPIYSGEEQIELARKAKAGNDQSRQKLILSNLRFVVTCAKHYSCPGISLMDLINAGNVGLIEAIRLYDPDKGYKFISFAVWYIRRAILKEIYNNGRTIRYPVTYISKITKVKKAYNDFIKNHEREPTEEELIELTNLTQKQYNSTLINSSYCQSLDQPLNDDGFTINDIVPSEESPYTDVFTSETIVKSLDILSPRERKVIDLFYGLEGYPTTAIKDIAKEMNIGDERIRQLRKSAIKKLREYRGTILKSLL